MICWPVTCQVSECSEVTSDHGSSATCRPHLCLGPLRPLVPMGLGTGVQQLWHVAQYLEKAPSRTFSLLTGLLALSHGICKDTMLNGCLNKMSRSLSTKMITDNWADRSLVSLLRILWKRYQSMSQLSSSGDHWDHWTLYSLAASSETIGAAFITSLPLPASARQQLLWTFPNIFQMYLIFLLALLVNRLAAVAGY